METQVNEQLNNEENNGLNPDQILASLAFTNNLNKQFIPQDVPEQSQEGQESPETASGQDLEMETEKTPPVDLETFKTEIMDELATIREEIKKSKGGDDEIETLRSEEH